MRRRTRRYYVGPTKELLGPLESEKDDDDDSVGTCIVVRVPKLLNGTFMMGQPSDEQDEQQMTDRDR